MIKFILKAALPVMIVAMGIVGITSQVRADNRITSLPFYCMLVVYCPESDPSSCRSMEYHHDPFLPPFTIFKRDNGDTKVIPGGYHLTGASGSTGIATCWYTSYTDHHSFRIQDSTHTVEPYIGYHYSKNHWNGQECVAISRGTDCPFRVRPSR